MYSQTLVVLALSAFATAQDSWSHDGSEHHGPPAAIASCLPAHPMGTNGWASALSAAIPAMQTSNPQLAYAAQDFLAHASASNWQAPATVTNGATLTAQLAAPTSSDASVADAVDGTTSASSWTAYTTATDYSTETLCPENSTLPAAATASAAVVPVLPVNGTGAVTADGVATTAVPSLGLYNSANATATQTWNVNPVGSDRPAVATSSGIPVQNSGAEKLVGSAVFGLVALAAFAL